jgi:hypothetical protein
LRVRIGKKRLLDFQRDFPWVSSTWGHFAWAFCLISLVVLGFFCTAIVFILHGDKHERYLVFVAFANITAHCFPACFVAIRLDILKASGGSVNMVSPWIIPLNLLVLPASVLPQLSPDITGFLLVSILVALHRISLTCPGAQHRLLLLQLSLGCSNDLYFQDQKEERGYFYVQWSRPDVKGRQTNQLPVWQIILHE